MAQHDGNSMSCRSGSVQFQRLTAFSWCLQYNLRCQQRLQCDVAQRHQQPQAAAAVPFTIGSETLHRHLQFQRQRSSICAAASCLTIQQQQPSAATSAVPERHLRGALATPPSVLATSSYLHPQGRNQLQRCAATWLVYVICAVARRASTSAQHRRQPCARHLQQKHLQRHISRLSSRTFDNSSSGVQRLRQPLDASSSATTQHLCLNGTRAFRQFLATTSRSGSKRVVLLLCN